jgi:hypothetical protein
VDNSMYMYFHCHAGQAAICPYVQVCIAKVFTKRINIYLRSISVLYSVISLSRYVSPMQKNRQSVPWIIYLL